MPAGIRCHYRSQPPCHKPTSRRHPPCHPGCSSGWLPCAPCASTWMARCWTPSPTWRQQPTACWSIWGWRHAPWTRWAPTWARVPIASSCACWRRLGNPPRKAPTPSRRHASASMRTTGTATARRHASIRAWPAASSAWPTSACPWPASPTSRRNTSSRCCCTSICASISTSSLAATHCPPKSRIRGRCWRQPIAGTWPPVRC